MKENEYKDLTKEMLTMSEANRLARNLESIEHQRQLERNLSLKDRAFCLVFAIVGCLLIRLFLGV